MTIRRTKKAANKRFLLFLLIGVALVSSIACKIPSIGRVVGNVGDALKNMFENIGRGFGF